ncbi:MAG: RpiB/LacA/LacB family sugar-phosphate isomerase [Rikenellaceae bacterium]
METKTFGLAADHAGFEKKELVAGYLLSLGYVVKDYGCYSEESVDYPDFAHALAKGIENGECARGFAFCGSANGITITLNKHQSIRAALSWIPEIAALARTHNDANVCSIPARFLDNTEVINIVDAFLEAEFEGGRHQNRVDKIACK